jgi:coenzyme F420-reducing hydrogenase alpha subunit
MTNLGASNPAAQPAAPAGRTIKVDALARVEGEGALHIRIKNGAITDLKFRIFEPPRYFEALLHGRSFTEVPDIVARICGICPIAYMLGASLALEKALGIAVTGPVADLRRLIYCGEWIQSHVLHTYLLHAPDFLDCADAIQIARHHPELVARALDLKKLGNRIMEVVGGRSVHPVNLRFGGLYRAPRKAEIRSLIEPLKTAIDSSLATIRWFSGFDFPDYDFDYAFVAMRDAGTYPIEAGRIVSNRGLDIAAEEFEQHFDETHVPHSR